MHLFIQPHSAGRVFPEAHTVQAEGRIHLKTGKV